MDGGDFHLIVVFIIDNAEQAEFRMQAGERNCEMKLSSR